jgi:hypothetical protein
MIALGLCGALPAGAQTSWQVLERWAVGGEGGWDYLSVQPGSSRLFVSRGNRVDGIDTSSGRIVGSVANTPGVHGIAFARALNRGYTSNGRANSVSMFALDTLAPIQEMKIPAANPHAILFEAMRQPQSAMSCFGSKRCNVMSTANASSCPPISVT